MNKRNGRKLCISLIFCTMMAAPIFGSRIAYRGLFSYKEEFDKATPAVDYPVCYNNVDMGYGSGDAKQFANAKLVFPEYYISWQEGEMDTNPKTNHLVQWIITYGGAKGKDLYGLKISREVMAGKPKGPIEGDVRILFESDVKAIRKVIKDAKNAGILERDDYKIIQMTKKPNVFTSNTRAQNILKMMDGVCYEVHHFTFNWPLEQGWSNTKDVVDGALWTLNNKNIHGKQLEYVFYYGPFKGWDCSDVEKGNDPFRWWLEEYWKKGLPKNHPNMIYDLNAFKHDCGSSRPLLPESDPYSIMGCMKWMIEQVKAAPAEKPTVKFTTPDNNAQYAAGEPFTITVEPTTEEPIDSIRLFIDGTYFRTEKVTPYQWGAPGAELSALTSGDHIITAIAYNSAGSSPEIALTVKIKNTPTSIAVKNRSKTNHNIFYLEKSELPLTIQIISVSGRVIQQRNITTPGIIQGPQSKGFYFVRKLKGQTVASTHSLIVY